jgi:hypothetical protein
VGISSKDKYAKSDEPTERYYSKEEIQRKDDESQAEYNARIPVGVQPVLPVADTDYLGRPRP